ncbi:SpoIIE family protein phosphatase [Steroidobacter sp.]|uniref:SpoIIE family protein phosphatase n=1 Tax=Steroidobacter sp. TaxID=1978227 RepID=UPI001A587D37|nr:SpoIIE family protein phosphatase [Steroidobacter sp.]MBL8267490.1 SpoIIE family protein phosphatase [Steroidobacter sp.]
MVARSSIGQLAIAAASLTPQHTCVDALEYFASHPEQDLLPIVSEGLPVGLVVRQSFVERFSRPFQHELFGSKSCSLFMDRAPLLADENESIAELGAMAATEPRRAIQHGLIVTANGRYVGTCSGPTLMRALADVQVARSRQVLEGIRYASRIQRAFLHTSNENLAEHLPQHRVFWEPRDLVGGDYYFCRGDQDRVLVAVLDCTGHGVPGALMTMIMSAKLEASISDVDSWRPSDILASINRRARAALGQRHSKDIEDDGPDDGPDDGMDASIVLIDRRERRLQFAGARLPVFVAYAGQPSWNCLPAGRAGVGYADTPDDSEWPISETPLEAGMRVAIATDGMFDQVGEARAIAYGKARFANSLGTGSRELDANFEATLMRYRQWQGNQARRDDATLLMFEV